MTPTRSSSSCTPLEGLVTAEAYARLAASSGRPDLHRKLAAVLLCRAGYERANGSYDLGDRAEAEAITYIVEAAKGQDLRATAALRFACADLATELLVEAAEIISAPQFNQHFAGNC
jgi:hypothetical protein